jgi:hypothetical protein
LRELQVSHDSHQRKNKKLEIELVQKSKEVEALRSLRSSDEVEHQLRKLQTSHDSHQHRNSELEIELVRKSKELEELRNSRLQELEKLRDARSKASHRYSFDGFDRQKGFSTDQGAKRHTVHNFTFDEISKHSSLLAVPKRRTSLMQGKLPSSPTTDIQELFPERGQIRRSSLHSSHTDPDLVRPVSLLRETQGEASGLQQPLPLASENSDNAVTKALTRHGLADLQKEANDPELREQLHAEEQTTSESSSPGSSSASDQSLPEEIATNIQSLPLWPEDEHGTLPAGQSTIIVHGGQDREPSEPMSARSRRTSDASRARFDTVATVDYSIEEPDDIIDRIEQVGWNNLSWIDGFTALHWAAEHSKLDLVAYLLNHRADPNEEDDNHKTAFDYAAKSEITLSRLRGSSGGVIPSTPRSIVISEKEKASFPRLVPKYAGEIEVLLHEPGSSSPTKLQSADNFGQDESDPNQEESSSGGGESGSSEDSESEEGSESEDSDEEQVLDPRKTPNSLHPGLATKLLRR